MQRAALLILASAVLSACGTFGAGQMAPLPPGLQECIGLERAQCLAMLDSQASARNLQPVAWRIRCTTTCDRNRGDVEMTVTWADGTTESSGMGWMGELVPPGGGPVPGVPQPGLPIPTPPVPPTCLGVPAQQCLGEWETSMQSLTEEDRAVVINVIVQCKAACTLLEGEGTTIAVFQDGTRELLGDWSYSNGP